MTKEEKIEELEKELNSKNERIKELEKQLSLKEELINQLTILNKKVIEEVQGCKFDFNDIQNIDYSKTLVYGEKTLEDGVYKGYFNKKGEREGKGKCINNGKDGGVYEGDFINGLPNGYGIYSYQNGDKYEGLFERNKKSGYGIFKFCDGNCYEGYFKDDLRQGNGAYSFKNGDKYEGNFFKDLFNGNGTIYYRDGKHIQKGKFTNGKSEKPEFFELKKIEINQQAIKKKNRPHHKE